MPYLKDLLDALNSPSPPCSRQCCTKSLHDFLELTAYGLRGGFADRNVPSDHLYCLSPYSCSLLAITFTSLDERPDSVPPLPCNYYYNTLLRFEILTLKRTCTTHLCEQWFGSFVSLTRSIVYFRRFSFTKYYSRWCSISFMTDISTKFWHIVCFSITGKMSCGLKSTTLTCHLQSQYLLFPRSFSIYRKHEP